MTSIYTTLIVLLSYYHLQLQTMSVALLITPYQYKRPEGTNLRRTSEAQDLSILSKLIKFREQKVKFKAKCQFLEGEPGSAWSNL